jgi:group I intron endonuclease
MGYIYVIQNIVNNKVYVGQTIRTVGLRWTEHVCCKKNLPFNNAIRKYGKKSFIFLKIEEIENEHLDNEEQKYIFEYNSIIPNGYNVHEGGNNLNLSRGNSSKGGSSVEGHIKQSIKVKEKYKDIQELNGLNVPCGISFKQQMKYSKLYYIFIVRKKGIKHKEFASTDISVIPQLLDNSIDYLNNELQKT